MKKIRESLEYPIPFWLSPIFLLSLIGFWLIFKWGFESTPDKWEYWKWVIEKVIYIGTVIGAAFWAQHIFNNNALNRENRERRLAKLDLMTSELNTIDNELRYLRSVKKDFKLDCREIVHKLSNLSHISVNYFDELAERPVEIIKNLTNNLKLYESGLEEYVLNNSTEEVLSRDNQPSLSEVVGQEVFSTAITLINDMKLQILITHNKIEVGKYND